METEDIIDSIEHMEMNMDLMKNGTDTKAMYAVIVEMLAAMREIATKLSTLEN